VTDPSAEALRERNRATFGSLPGGLYSFYIQRPRLARVVGALLWDGNAAPFYGRLAVVRALPPGALVVDAPCGAGVTGLFGPTGTPDDLAAWLERAGLTRTRLDVSGPFAYFEASA